MTVSYFKTSISYPSLLCGLLAVTVLTIFGCGDQSLGIGGGRSWIEQRHPEHPGLWHDVGLEAAVFEIQAPPDAKVMVWLETYQQGELVEDLSWGGYMAPPVGESVREQFHWSAYRPPREEPSGRAKWSLVLGGLKSPRWVDDPFANRKKGPVAMSGNHPRWAVELGKTYTLWHKATSESGDVPVFPEADLKQNDVAMLLKCRVEPADPNREVGSMGSLDEIPP